ncbi:MAG: DUF4249 family protein [Bacteroidota bacterium]
MKNLSLFLAFLLLVAVTACEDYGQDDYQEFYVVESYLIADQPLGLLSFSTTNPAFEPYIFEEVAIPNARISVHLMDANTATTVEQTFTYTETEIGRYYPDQPHTILPGRIYELDIQVEEGGNQIRARTIIPGDFDLMAEEDQDLVYQSEEDQLELRLTPSFYPGRQSVYIISSIAQDVRLENFTPLYLDFFDEDDDDVEDFRATSSGTLNEGNFTVNADQTISLDFPWFAIAFFGENDIVVTTIDDNVLDFVNSQEVQLGGFTVSPGEIQNLVYNLNGAIGIFGGMTTDTVRTNILRP